MVAALHIDLFDRSFHFDPRLDPRIPEHFAFINDFSRVFARETVVRLLEACGCEGSRLTFSKIIVKKKKHKQNK